MDEKLKNSLSVLAVAFIPFALHPSVSSAEATMLSADALRTAVVGRTLSGTLADGRDVKMTINPDGTMVSVVGTREFKGTWEIKSDGHWCRAINNTNQCQTTKREGDILSFVKEDGSVSSKFNLK